MALLRPLTRICLRRYASSAAASATPKVKEKYDLFAGVIIERLPIITKTLNPFEEKFQKYLARVEFENSLKSDHELRVEKEIALAQALKKNDADVDLDAEVMKQSAQDFEDACMEELQKFQFAPRTTEADKKGDLRSLNRKLEETLVLVVEQALGKSKVQVLPQIRWEEGETMRQTAERTVREVCGGDLKVMFYGNAPCGFYRYKYPGEARGKTVGAKIFFYRATLRGGAVKEEKTKFKWLTKEELPKALKQPYCSTVQDLLI